MPTATVAVAAPAPTATTSKVSHPVVPAKKAMQVITMQASMPAPFEMMRAAVPGRKVRAVPDGMPRCRPVF